MDKKVEMMMVIEINNYFTGMLEALTNGCAFDLPEDTSYLVFENIEIEGKVRNVHMKAGSIAECWSLHNTNKKPSWLKDQYIEPLFKAIVLNR